MIHGVLYNDEALENPPFKSELMKKSIEEKDSIDK
jgi:hypothetical protein